MGKGNGLRRSGIGDGDGDGAWGVVERPGDGVGMEGGGRRVLDMGVDRGEGP